MLFHVPGGVGVEWGVHSFFLSGFTLIFLGMNGLRICNIIGIYEGCGVFFIYY